MYSLNSLQNKDFNQWLYFVLIGLGMLGSSYVLDAFASYLEELQIQKINRIYRLRMINYYYSNSEQHNLGDIQNAMLSDLIYVDNQYFKSISQVVYFTGFLIFSGMALASIHWILLVISILSFLISTYLPKMFNVKIAKSLDTLSNSNADYIKTIGQWLKNIEEVRRYFSGDILLDVTGQSAKKIEEASNNLSRKQQQLSALTALLSSLMSFAITLITSLFIFQGNIEFGAISIVGSLNAYFGMGLRFLPFFIQTMKSTVNLRNKIESNSEQDYLVDSNVNLSSAKRIEIRNLTYRYPNGKELSFPDVNIDMTERTLLTGSNGTGKSTFMKLLLGNIKPSSGTVRYFDINNKEIALESINFAYLPQSPFVFPESVKNNITMFNHDFDDYVNEIIKKVDLVNDIHNFSEGIDTIIDVDNLNISGGQRQKVVLGRSIVREANYIFIDEGTSNIDKVSTAKILKNINSNQGGLLLIAHQFSDEMKSYFDREIDLSQIEV